MTQENKELLIKDLSARLSYGVKIELMPITRGKCTTLTPIILLDYFISDDVNYLPYLFPLSSMTKEDIYQINDILGEDFEVDEYGITDLIRNRCTSLSYLELDALFSYFNKNHFDYRGLIPKGLALDATNLNIY